MVLRDTRHLDAAVTALQIEGEAVAEEDAGRLICYLQNHHINFHSRYVFDATSPQRFGQNVRSHQAAAGQAEQLLTYPDLSDTGANRARRTLLAATRGCGENRDLFENLPNHVTWARGTPVR